MNSLNVPQAPTLTLTVPQAPTVQPPLENPLNIKILATLMATRTATTVADIVKKLNGLVTANSVHTALSRYADLKIIKRTDRGTYQAYADTRERFWRYYGKDKTNILRGEMGLPQTARNSSRPTIHRSPRVRSVINNIPTVPVVTIATVPTTSRPSLVDMLMNKAVSLDTQQKELDYKRQNFECEQAELDRKRQELTQAFMSVETVVK
jgi:hypothetical protein